MSFSTYLTQQAALHAAMQPQDAVKLCYQAAFGAEHLLEDIEGARSYFDEEFAAVQERDIDISEQIAQDFHRINLAAWKKHRLPPEWLFNLFAWTANHGQASGGEAAFTSCLQQTGALADQGALPFSATDWHAFRAQYEEGAIRPVHHSEAYRRDETPSYRVVTAQLARAIPLLQALAALPCKDGAHILAIDGRAASGKTTLAAQLGYILGAGVIHMDDFFLPQALRTEQRFAQPGGNVHYERFAQEVVPHLSDTNAFSYRTFDCTKMDYGEWRPVKASKWRVVEGAYSGHPALGAYMDVRAFVSVEPKEQMQRILARDGEQMAAMFTARWLPFEEAYFAAYDIIEKADVVLTFPAARR